MRVERIEVEVPGSQAWLCTYFMDNSPEIDPERRRPLVVVCPGGGYEFCSDREAEPVALQFAAMGFQACVLRYSVAPARFPQAVTELAWSVACLRERADAFHVDPEKIYVCGFSAGGHLAASLGAFWNTDWLAAAAGTTAEAIRPNGLILSYPVITSGEAAHRGSFDNLLGEGQTAEQLERVSLEKQVGETFPPTFVWHTWTDESVPVENTLLLSSALRRAGVPAEVHIYCEGPHGLSLANEETRNKENGFGVQRHCQSWIRLAGEWLREQE